MANMVASPLFEVGFLILIVFNTFTIAAEVQYHGMNTGFEHNHLGYTTSAEDAWPAAEDAFYILEMVFGVLFTIEVVVKIVCLRSVFIRESWNWFDTLIISLWLLDTIFGLAIDVNVMLFRVLRLMRLIRLLRVVKWLQMMDSLHVIIYSIWASLSVVIWSSFVLVSIMVLVALLLSMLLQSHMSSSNVYIYFGTFTKSLLSVFELTFGNFAPITRTIVDNVDNEWWGLLFCIYKILAGFSVIAVINGVFLHETFKVADSNDDLMLIQKQRAMADHAKKMQALFLRADNNHDGRLGWDEFKKILDDEAVRTWLSGMELDVRDPYLLFKMLDSQGDGVLSAEELVKGSAKLKGAAKSFDMAILMQDVRHVRKMTEHVEHLLGGSQSIDETFGLLWSDEYRKSNRRPSTPQQPTIFEEVPGFDAISV